MRKEAALPGAGDGLGRGSFLPSSLRMISTYWRSVSSNAGVLASNVRSAGAAAVAGGITVAEDERRKEQVSFKPFLRFLPWQPLVVLAAVAAVSLQAPEVHWAGFDVLELGGQRRQVLLLTYSSGFQVWDVENADNVRELVSRRDGFATCLRLLPPPLVPEPADGPLRDARPLLAVVGADNTGNGGGPGAYAATVWDGGTQPAGSGASTGYSGMDTTATAVRFYSLKTHTYVTVLRFRTHVLAVRCSRCLVAVALASQIYCFDAATLQNTFSVLTFPVAQPGQGITAPASAAMALGSRWLAYAANQPMVAPTGRASPQHLSPSPGASPSTSPAGTGGAALMARYAKESGKHLAAGIVNMGYKTISRYYAELSADVAPKSSTAAGSTPSPKGGSARAPAWASLLLGEPEFAGTVMVRDVITRAVVAHFRAHSSPLSAIAFDQSGTLLVTASVCGHNLNVFRLIPAATSTGLGSGSSSVGTGGDPSNTHVHLYKLYRGLTNAVIQDISFCSDGHWIAVSSARGTTHVYAISPFGGPVGLNTHAVDHLEANVASGVPLVQPLPWWAPQGPLRLAQQHLPPPPPPIALSVVTRIRSGIQSWRGAAAAATGRAVTFSSAVASLFHDGGGTAQEHQLHQNTASVLRQQLWVLTPAGYLVRYLLRPYLGGEGGSSDGTGVQELRLAAEPLERWDVCRGPSWMEREERMDENSLVQTSSQVPLKTEELQRWFMSNAEVQMGANQPLPLWANPQVEFHVFQPAQWDQAEAEEGEVKVEAVPTKVIEVRRTSLMPLMDAFAAGQGVRDSVLEALPGDPGLRVHAATQASELHGGPASVIQDRQAAAPHLQMRRTNSGSSSGSESGPLSVQLLHGVPSSGTLGKLSQWPPPLVGPQSQARHGRHAAVGVAWGRKDRGQEGQGNGEKSASAAIVQDEKHWLDRAGIGGASGQLSLMGLLGGDDVFAEDHHSSDSAEGTPPSSLDSSHSMPSRYQRQQSPRRFAAPPLQPSSLSSDSTGSPSYSSGAGFAMKTGLGAQPMVVGSPPVAIPMINGHSQLKLTSDMHAPSTNGVAAPMSMLEGTIMEGKAAVALQVRHGGSGDNTAAAADNEHDEEGIRSSLDGGLFLFERGLDDTSPGFVKAESPDSRKVEDWPSPSTDRDVGPSDHSKDVPCEEQDPPQPRAQLGIAIKAEGWRSDGHSCSCTG
eukprot:SM000006S19439  [mRNA]  locus=s6:707062:712117:- [translate_table: standard]